MNKHEFLHALLQSLSPLPQAEREKAYAFYAEIIDDSMEDGMSEEEAIQRLGSMDEIVERIIAETPIKVLLQSRVERRNRSLLTILLLVFGFPVWFPVLAALLTVLLTLFIVLWTVALSLWAVGASSAAAALLSCVGFFSFPGVGLRLIFLGSALACAGCAAPAFMVSLYATRQFARLTKQLWMKMKNNLFRKRGNEQ
ncbi:MAG: DUF1700 domain-containing protein [Bacillota bacterium]